MARERTTTLNLRVSEEERAKIHAIAEAHDESAAQTIRRFIKQRYAAEFGEVEPSALARGGGSKR